MENTKKKGRPKGTFKHHYKKEYAKMLIEHMRTGRSFESFGGKLEVGKSVLYRWEEENKDFLDAKLVGFSVCLLYWEDLCLENIIHTKDGPQINAGLYRINMKNRFGWHDAQKIEHSVEKSDSKLVIDFTGSPRGPTPEKPPEEKK